MSEAKYVKEPSNPKQLIKSVLLIAIPIIFIIFLVRITLRLPENPLMLLIYPELYLLISISIAYIYLHLESWKYMIYNAESDIYA